MSTARHARVCDKCKKIVLKPCLQKISCQNFKDSLKHEVVDKTHSVWFPGKPLLK